MKQKVQRIEQCGVWIGVYIEIGLSSSIITFDLGGRRLVVVAKECMEYLLHFINRV